MAVRDPVAALPSTGMSVVKPRSELAYRQLATDTIHVEDWKTVPSKSAKARSRAIGRMMLRAVSDG